MNEPSYKSEIPFHITKKTAIVTLLTFLALDLLFVVLYLISTLPEIRELTVSHRLACLDLDVEGNLPTNYAILKLYFSSIISILMIFWYKNTSPLFWKVAAIVLFIIGLDESAGLHELWAAGIATKLFGNQYLHGNQYTILPYAFILGTFYLSSLRLFPKNSKLVFVCFILSGISFILSQDAEWTFRPAMAIMSYTFEMLSPALGGGGKETFMIAWEEGLEMIGYSLLCGGVIIGIAMIQNRKQND